MQQSKNPSNLSSRIKNLKSTHVAMIVAAVLLAVVGFMSWRVTQSSVTNTSSSAQQSSKVSASTADTSSRKDIAASIQTPETTEKAVAVANASPVETQAIVSKHLDAVANPDKTFDLVVDPEESKLKSGPSNIVVNLNDRVRVNISVPEEEARVTLKGYNINTEADPYAPGGFSFVADQKGTFEFYGHDEYKKGVTYPLGTIIVE